jgi:hypothetical protein
MIDDNTNALAQNAATPLNGIAGSLASIDRHTLSTIEITKATQHLHYRFGFLLALGYLLVPVLGVFLAWQGYSLYRQNQELHAQTRAIVQANQTLIGELLGRTPPR